MIVVRFKVQCKAEKKAEQVLVAFKEVIVPSRKVDGVVNFDIGRLCRGRRSARYRQAGQ